MVNSSKANDPRFWDKWRQSGAVGDYYDAFVRQILPEINGLESHSKYSCYDKREQTIVQRQWANMVNELCEAGL
jgi:hypothetical protein